jgi:hypothetical protein
MCRLTEQVWFIQSLARILQDLNRSGIPMFQCSSVPMFGIWNLEFGISGTIPSGFPLIFKSVGGRPRHCPRILIVLSCINAWFYSVRFQQCSKYNLPVFHILKDLLPQCGVKQFLQPGA